MKEQKRVKARRFLWLGLLSCFGVLLVFSGFMIAHALMKSEREQAAFDALSRAAEQQVVQKAEAPAPAAVPDTEPEPEKVILPAFAALYEQNADLAGWITVPGTKIDYPVMQKAENPDYYLDHAFDGSESQSGVPFIGIDGDTDGDYFIIHAHNMRNDSMFGSLDHYKSADFWQENQTLQFSTLYEGQHYAIFAAVQTRIRFQDEEGFRYYQVGSNLSEGEFDEMAGWLVSESLYDTGIVPAYGDQIVVLSTCSYHTDNGRFIIAARRLP